eukprot:GHVT01079060.1.p1 GENE.GHVT01079060.1~~GHVT01079060.1.p1  ORF type:complete len:112 (-),score=31.22 GHVT01079060.1:955-1254(-)
MAVPVEQRERRPSQACAASAVKLRTSESRAVGCLRVGRRTRVGAGPRLLLAAVTKAPPACSRVPRGSRWPRPCEGHRAEAPLQQQRVPPPGPTEDPRET